MVNFSNFIKPTPPLYFIHSFFSFAWMIPLLVESGSFLKNGNFVALWDRRRGW